MIFDEFQRVVLNDTFLDFLELKWQVDTKRKILEYNLRSCKFICKNELCMNLELPFELVDSLCQSLAEGH